MKIEVGTSYMDYVNYVPPSEYYISNNESEEQIEDVIQQYGEIEKDNRLRFSYWNLQVRCSIPRQSVYRLLKEFNDSNGSVLPGFAPKAKNRGTKQKLFPQHTIFLI